MQRYKYLDGIRGVAALIVVICHFFQFFLPAAFFETAPTHLLERWLATSPFNILINGSFAVALFFVISGFVLSAPSFAGKGRRWYLIAAIRRYPRLAIPAVASTVLAWLTAKLIGFHYSSLMLVSGAQSPDTFSSITSLNEAFWQGSIGAFFFSEFTYNRVLWTISTELIGSFMIYLTVPFISYTRLRFVMYAVAVICLRDNYLLGFVLGTMCADFATNVKCKPSRLWLLLLLIGIYFGSYPYYGAEASWWRPLARLFKREALISTHAIGGALCILAIAHIPRAMRIFESRKAGFLARISYSLYLVHFTYWASVGSWMVLELSDRISYATALSITLLISVPTLSFLAFLFARAVDEPTIALMHKVRLPLSRFSQIKN